MSRGLQFYKRRNPSMQDSINPRFLFSYYALNTQDFFITIIIFPLSHYILFLQLLL